MIKILLLEDDFTLNNTLSLFLKKEGYIVDSAYSVQEAIDLSFEKDYDLYLFDINLPQESSLSLLSDLRDGGDNTATIFITADNTLTNLEDSFKLGAIDYIKKPFDPIELKIRIASRFKKEEIVYKDLIYDQKKDILKKSGKIVSLGNINHKIFTKLLLNIDKIVLKEDLYIYFDHISDTALRVSINAIKQKLQIDIKNIRSKGYMLESI